MDFITATFNLFLIQIQLGIMSGTYIILFVAFTVKPMQMAVNNFRCWSFEQQSKIHFQML
jgi:hypothetical protein